MKQQPPPHPRRRNSMSTKITIPLPDRRLHSCLPNGSRSSSSPSFELISLKSPPTSSSSTSYTSIKDLLPSTAAIINSPTAGSAANPFHEISIRNRLVKQAACAYLQPMSSSPDSSGPQFFSRIMLKLCSAHDSISHCFRLFTRFLSRALDRLLRSVCLHVSR